MSKFHPRAVGRRARNGRRGFTLIEMIVAGGIGTMLVVVIAGLMSIASRMSQSTYLRTSADLTAVGCVDQMIMDIREAKSVTIMSTSRIRVFFPVKDANGKYDRTRLNSTNYIEYAETNASGTPTVDGGYLWRKSDTTTGYVVAKNIQNFAITSFSSNALRVTVDVRVTSGSAYGSSNLDQRVIYLRNY